MAAGNEYHYRHGRKVLAADLMHLAGILLLLAAVVLFVVFLIMNWLG